MSNIVPGAFVTSKVRERNMLLAKMQAKENNHQYDYPESRLTELSPVKYNSKLMNSIWGLYNRYSVHNFKQNTDANIPTSHGEQQKKEMVAPTSNVGLDSTAANYFTNAFNEVIPKMLNIH